MKKLQTLISSWCNDDDIEYNFVKEGVIVEGLSYYEALDFEQFTGLKISDPLTLRNHFSNSRPMNLSFWVRYPEFDSCIPDCTKNHALVSATINQHNSQLVHSYESMRSRFSVLFIEH